VGSCVGYALSHDIPNTQLQSFVDFFTLVCENPQSYYQPAGEQALLLTFEPGLLIRQPSLPLDISCHLLQH
jgi:hypothetical protein